MAGFFELSCVRRCEVEWELEDWVSSASKRSISFLAFSMFYGLLMYMMHVAEKTVKLTSLVFLS